MKRRARTEGVYVDGLVRAIGIPWERLMGSLELDDQTATSIHSATLAPEPDVLGAPLRKVRSRSKTTVAGNFASLTMGRQIETEGILETFFVPFLDLDTSITAYVEQPTRIRLIYDGKEKQYTPDFLVLYRDGRLEVVEVKPSADVTDELIHYLGVIASILRARNIAFRLIDETDAKDKHLFNNVSLLDYAKRAPMSQTAWTAYVAAREERVYEPLRALSWFDCLTLIARGHIRVRIDRPLSREAFEL